MQTINIPFNSIICRQKKYQLGNVQVVEEHSTRYTVQEEESVIFVMCINNII